MLASLMRLCILKAVILYSVSFTRLLIKDRCLAELILLSFEVFQHCAEVTMPIKDASKPLLLPCLPILNRVQKSLAGHKIQIEDKRGGQRRKSRSSLVVMSDSGWVALPTYRIVPAPLVVSTQKRNYVHPVGWSGNQPGRFGTSAHSMSSFMNNYASSQSFSVVLRAFFSKK